jgi:hypothetical protein
MWLGEELRKAAVRSHDLAMRANIVPMVGCTNKEGGRNWQG